jgi:hypothetical protein
VLARDVLVEQTRDLLLGQITRIRHDQRVAPTKVNYEPRVPVVEPTRLVVDSALGVSLGVLNVVELIALWAVAFPDASESAPDHRFPWRNDVGYGLHSATRVVVNVLGSPAADFNSLRSCALDLVGSRHLVQLASPQLVRDRKTRWCYKTSAARWRNHSRSSLLGRSGLGPQLSSSSIANLVGDVDREVPGVADGHAQFVDRHLDEQTATNGD